MKRKMRANAKLIAFAMAVLLCFQNIPIFVDAKETNDDPLVVVSLGDSYSSGEGITPFYGQDSVIKKVDADWVAHRSQNSWASMLEFPTKDGYCVRLGDYRVENILQFDEANRTWHYVPGNEKSSKVKWYFVASSGAETKDFLLQQKKTVTFKEGDPFFAYFNPGTSKQYNCDLYLPPQFAVFDAGVINDDVDYVTLTIGGNDLGFAEIMETVTKMVDINKYAYNIKSIIDQKIDEFNNTIKTRLEQTYHIIHIKAPKATIVVAGYPRLLNKKGYFLSENEANEVNRGVAVFNQGVQDIIRELNEEFGKDTFVFVDVAPEYEGHESSNAGSEGENGAWIRPVIIGTRSEDIDQTKGYSDYSYHPNIYGAQAYARCINKEIERIEQQKQCTIENHGSENGYFPACDASYASIVDALNSIGVDSAYSNRERIASANGITGYTGSADQNISMLDKLKAGILINPDSTGGSHNNDNPQNGSSAYYHLFPVKDGILAYSYGYSDSYGSSFHTGIDIHATSDDTIYSACNGVVEQATDPCWHWAWAATHSWTEDCGHFNTFGNYIRIRNEDGTYSYYGHLAQGSLKVSAGDSVKAGQAIATMGASGCATGKHLHYEVRSTTNSSDTINTNPTSNGGSMVYSYSGYGGTTAITYETIASGNYRFLNKATNTYLNVDNGEDYNDCNVRVWERNNTDAQIWEISGNDKARYQIKPLCTVSRVLNQYGNTVVAGNNVDIWDNTYDDTQRWAFEKVSDGYVIHCTGNTNCVLDVDGNGNVCVWNYVAGNPSQIWKLESATCSHTWNSGTITQAATTRAEGVRTYTCTKCGTTYTESIPKLKCTITYNANGGTGAPASQEYTYVTSGTINLSSTEPTRTGYSFLGWALSADASTATSLPGHAWPLSNDGNYTLYAVWQRNAVEVHIRPNGGVYNGSSTELVQSYYPGDRINLATPTRDGYTFVGWMIDLSDGGHILEPWGRPQWQDPVFTNSYSNVGVYDNNGTGKVTVERVDWTDDAPTRSAKVMRVTSDSSAEPGMGGFVQLTFSRQSGIFYHMIVAKIPAGYQLNFARNHIGIEGSQEWLTSQEGTGNYETYIYKTVCGTTGDFSSFGFVYLTKTNSSAADKVTWDVAYSEIFDATGVGSENTYTVGEGMGILTALWKRNKVEVRIRPNGGVYNSSATEIVQSYYPGSVIELATPTREGYSFVGWMLDLSDDGHILEPYGRPLWQDPVFTNSYGGVGVYDNNNTGKVTIERVDWADDAPTRSTKVMRVTSDSSADPYMGGFVQLAFSKESGVFYHVFVAKIPEGYNVNFAKNHIGTDGYQQWITPSKGTGHYETYIYKTVCGSTGDFSSFGFVYLTRTYTNVPYTATWDIAYSEVFDATGIENGNRYTVGNGTGILSALWKANTYTISYDANGGKRAPGTQEYVYSTSGQTYLSSSIPVRPGYSFQGWSLSSTATSATYSAGQSWSLSNGSNYILYAVWQQNPAEESAWAYTLSNGEAKVTGFDIDVYGSTNVVIPNTLGGCPVTAIGEYAFVNCVNMTSIEIPSSVTYMGMYAFGYCVNLTSIDIPSGVTIIPDYAFYACHGLKSFIIPYGVTTIRDYAFLGCSSLTSIEIPPSVTGIYEAAFANCRALKSIEIPSCVTFISANAFADCISLTSIDVMGGNPVYHSEGNCLINTERKTLVAGCKNSVIPTDGSVTSIGQMAFLGCEGLTGIEIPLSVTSIGSGAFSSCSSLTSIIIPSGVTSLEYATFSYCSSLKEVEIPSSVTNIKYGVFGSCTALTDVYFSGTKEQAVLICTELADDFLKNATWHYNSNMPSPYTVTYDANGGIGAPTAQTKIRGVDLTLSSVKPNKNYKITYNANGGTVSKTSKSVSCTFKSWNSLKNGSGTSYSSGGVFTENASATLYAQWTNPKVGTLATPTRDGYAFDGWFTAAEGGNQVTSSSVVSANTTLYAHWTKINTNNLRGDLDDDGKVTDDDAIFLLFHTFFPENYPISQDADFNKDGKVDDDDAIYLLFYVFFPEVYPLK